MGIIVVGIGGFLGVCGRYLLTKLFEQINPSFPFGTLLSNIIAALLIGFIVGIERGSILLSDNTKLFLITGLLGGLSTFSAFSIETIRYIEDGKFISATSNVILNVGLSLLFVVLGMLIAKTFVRTA